MKHSKVVVSLLLLSCASAVLAQSSATATPYFNARSQSANVALEMVGQQGYINRFNTGENYSVLSLTAGYQQSFRGGDIACCLFGQDLVQSNGCGRINISGSSTSNRGSKDWLADYFGLANNYVGSIKFEPRIRNVLVDLNFYMGLDSYKEGMYFEAHIPFVHSSWELDPCESISTKGDANHPFGYFSGNNPSSSTAIGNANSELLQNARDFFSNQKTPSLSNTLRYGPVSGVPATQPCDELVDTLTQIEFTDAITFESLNYARWACDKLKKSGVADFRFTLGYNAYSSEKFHVGFGITGAAPTGNRPHGEYLFEPILGNGNHWELGGQFTSHYRFWTSEDEEKHFTAYLDANLTHLFKARQTRSFDLKNKPNSRYMLAQKLGESCFLYNATLQKCLLREGASPMTCATASATQQGIVTSGLTKAPAEFKNAYAPVANLTTVDVNVNIGAQIDLGLMFNYTLRNWSFDLGYNLWARTCERIKLDCSCPTRLEDGSTWALKGTAYVYGANGMCNNVNFCTDNCFDNTALAAAFNADLGESQPYPLGATQSKATIYGAPSTATATPTATPTTAYKNNNIDNPRFAFARIDANLCSLNNEQVDTGTNTALAANRQETSPATVYSALNSTRNGQNASTNSRVLSSKAPVYLTNNDLDLDGAATKGLSHKVFGHISYQWTSKDDYVPFLGIGASGEFVNNSGNCCSSSTTSTSSSTSTQAWNSCNSSCDLSCKRCGLSQWSVWVKGGISFN